MKTTSVLAFATILLTTLPSRFTFAECHALAPGEDSSTPHSWCWPLYRPTRDENGDLAVGRARQLVYNGFGDFQALGTGPKYLHPGIDIMASYINDVTLSDGTVERLPDITVVPYDSELIWVFDHDDCQGQSISGGQSMHCRLFFRTQDDNFLYYFGHTRYSKDPQPGEAEPNTRIRAALEALLPQNGSTAGGYRCADTTGACTFRRGDFGPMLTEFPGFNHLHFTIVDRKNNYDNVTPFEYLATQAIAADGTRTDTSDDQYPVVSSVALVPNDLGSRVASVVRSGECGPEVSGDVDVAAEAYDVFREPEPNVPLPERMDVGTDNEMAVHSARYSIERIVDPSTRQVVQEGTWYDFSQAPMFCPGPDRGLSCPYTFATPSLSSPDDDLYLSVHTVWGWPDEHDISWGTPPMGLIPTIDSSGARALGSGYSLTLYRYGLSSSSFTNKRETLVLTDEWGFEQGWRTKPGLNTSWDTTKMSDGSYEVKVEVSDHSGHATSSAMTVRVRNGNRGDKDIWVADSEQDIGTVPSDDNGQPYDSSPDVLVIAAAGDNGSEPNSTTPIDSLEALEAYHVWIRVRYGLCQSITGIKVALASVDPADTGNQGSWKWIAGSRTTFVGPSWAPGGAALGSGQDADWIGPFAWTPNASEAGSRGGRLLVAAVTSDDDPATSAEMTDVPGHNNVAERKVSIALSCPTINYIHIATGYDSSGGCSGSTWVDNITSTTSDATTCSYWGTQWTSNTCGNTAPDGTVLPICSRQLTANGKIECSMVSARTGDPLTVLCPASGGACCVLYSLANCT